MDLFSDALQLITQPPGDLVYFLVTLFALQQAWMSTFSSVERSAGPLRYTHPRLWRWRLSTGGMLLGRLILMLVGLAALAGFFTPTKVLPPVERWVDLVTVLMLAWALYWT